MMINNGLKTRLREEAKATLSPTKENTDAKKIRKEIILRK
jgi:hypothetical protein